MAESVSRSWRRMAALLCSDMKPFPRFAKQLAARIHADDRSDEPKFITIRARSDFAFHIKRQRDGLPGPVEPPERNSAPLRVSFQRWWPTQRMLLKTSGR